MSITLKELYNEFNKKYKLKLLAGKSCTDNIVSWFNIMEDETTMDFISENELIVTTCLGAKDEKWLIKFIQGLINRKVTGLIVTLGPYISEIPEYAIIFCNDNNFPLLTMPWEVHFVDIKQDFCNTIINAKQHSLNICTAFFNAVFSPEQKNSYVPYLKQAGYNLDDQFIIISFDLKKSLYEKISERKLKNFIMRIENTLHSFAFKYSILVQNKEFNIVINLINHNSLNHLENYVMSYFKRYPQVQHIGVSSPVKSIENLHRAYNEALNAKLSAIKNKKLIIHYSDMGLDKLLLNITDEKILYDLYNKYLGLIHNYDKIHNTDYEYILKVYLKNNGSIQAVSKETYTHRNTINYRIKKIKEILNSQLDDSEEKFNYMLAFHIKEILDMNESKNNNK